MAATLISDIIKPSVFIPYLIERTAQLSALIQSGIVVPDSRLDELAQKGGIVVEMPFFTDLGNGADEVLSDTAGLSVDKIGTKTDRARLQMRGKAWGVNDLAKALSGADPMGAIADLVAAFWNRREQDFLLATLAGMFASNATANAGTGNALFGAANDLIYSATTQTAGGADVGAGNRMGPDAFISANGVLGDAGGNLTAILMHSTPYTQLQKLQLVELIPDAETKILIPYYMGKRVIVDDGCPSAVNATSTKTEFTSYLFGAGAIGRGEGSAPVPVETHREKLKGEEYLINRRHFILHPRGVQWTDTTCVGASPTNVEVALAANWKRVYEKKNIRIVKLVTNA